MNCKNFNVWLVFGLLLALLCFPALTMAKENSAEEAAEKAKEEQEKKDSFFMSKIYSQGELAETYMKANKPDKAIEMFRKIVGTQIPADFSPEKKTEMIHQKIFAFHGMKDVYLEQKGDKSNARKALLDTIPLVEMLDQSDPEVKTKLIYIYKDIGQTYKEEGQLDEAIKYLEKASQLE